ncbi:hypothetical protein KIN34_03240 [Cellulomonas sp. DKR-3]|uniref:Alpha-amylase n=1 Tax=Cellulomonas fulva TaxID=2835530 RepID=A0ABS5TVX2_9CELL|nr:carboxypeptidase-like regulatory domain-containing protein [Cellulomonas fulva]MBT0993302.1 hypothetical protein [Cellulomonas fulva]
MSSLSLPPARQAPRGGSRVRAALVGVVAAALALSVVPSTAAEAAVATISGVVKVDGRPLPAVGGRGARVTVTYWEPSTGVRKSVLSDAETGAYAIRAPGTAPFYVSANVVGDFRERGRELAGFAPVFVGRSGAHAYASQMLEPLPTLVGPRTLALELDRTGSVAVVGTDAARYDSIALMAADGSQVAQGDGPTTWRDLVPGRYSVKAVSTLQEPGALATPSWSTELGEVVVRPGERTTVTPDLGDVSGEVSGVVRHGGTPVPGATVDLERASTIAGIGGFPAGGWARVTTDSKGRYRVGPGILPLGSYLVTATSDSLGAVPQTVELTADTVATHDVDVRRTGAVSVSTGAATADHQVEMALADSANRTVTDDVTRSTGGSRSLHAVPGTYTLVVHDLTARTYLKREVVVTAGRTTTVAPQPMRATVRISGVVQNGGGRPSSVWIYGPAQDGNGAAYTRTSSSGYYVLESVVPGRRQRLKVRGFTDSGSQIDRWVRVAPGVPLATRLPDPAGAITGRLTFDGRPYRGLLVAEGARGHESIQVKSTGEFVVPPLRGWGSHVRLRTLGLPASVGDVPFRLVLPAAVRSVTTPSSGTTLDLGTVDLRLLR